MILVTGGYSTDVAEYKSTEVASYSQGGPFWRFAGNLPASRRGLRAVQFGNTIIVTGGETDGLQDIQPFTSTTTTTKYPNPRPPDPYYSTTVLTWDPSSETWSKIGRLNLGRAYHASLAVDTSLFSFECLSSRQ